MTETAFRTHGAGVLTEDHVGQQVTLAGWVHRRRDLGAIVFLDLRDYEGLVQLSCDPEWTPPEVLTLASTLGAETVVQVKGEVVRRPEPGRDQKMRSRNVEVHVVSLRVLSLALTPPVPVSRKEGEELPAEERRLRYRVLDLRRTELQHNLRLRHELLQMARSTLCARGFLEIETPILTKPTPEGARDYLVPSRVHAGEFYALPQSPQIYKQLLMVAGFDRYFQIARCFRDEDLRADRQPEFTQIDLEASFVGREDVFPVVEDVLAALWRVAGHEAIGSFPQLSWHEAMERFGTDKPDLRFGLELEDWTDMVSSTDCAPFLAESLQEGRLRGIRLSEKDAVSRRELEVLTDLAKAEGAGGLLWMRRADNEWAGQGAKLLGGTFRAAMAGTVGEMLLAVSGPDRVTSPALHVVRRWLGARTAAGHEVAHAFAWIVDFPLFERDPATGAHVPAHHPFTAPHPDDVPFLTRDPGRCRAQHYDVVYNGHELGSGSIRITDATVQETIFGLLGLTPEECQRRFGFLLEALQMGAPPHGGFALGFDRIAMLLAGASSLRDVIAFPKTTAARALFEHAPTPLTDAELAAVHLALRPESE